MLKMMFAAPASDSGKTSVVCGMLSLLRRKGYLPCAFKCGPDYIDPMFHRSVLGVPSHNIDLFMSDGDRAKAMFGRYMKGHDACVVEGVMGFYDGLSGSDTKASAYDVSETLGIPVILVVRPKGEALTLAAVIKGIKEFRTPNRIAGVILNDCSKGMYGMYAGMCEKETGVPVIGYVPHLEGADFKSRHLGLYTAGEIDDLTGKIARIADAMEEGIDFGKFEKLFDDGKSEAGDGSPEGTADGEASGRKPLIAVARDEAFNFIYEETIDTIKDSGAGITEFSPLHDEGLPEGISGLYIPGGYPELYAETLSLNKSMRDSVREAVLSGLPTVAECGGFLYLGKALEGSDGKMHEMAGALPGEAKNKGKLVRFGYADLTSDKDSLLLKKGEKVPVHEFHYWDSTDNGSDLTASKRSSGRSWECGFATDTMYAGFPHLYMAGTPVMAERFVSAAKEYMEKNSGSTAGGNGTGESGGEAGGNGTEKTGDEADRNSAVETYFEPGEDAAACGRAEDRTEGGA